MGLCTVLVDSVLERFRTSASRARFSCHVWIEKTVCTIPRTLLPRHGWECFAYVLDELSGAVCGGEYFVLRLCFVAAVHTEEMGVQGLIQQLGEPSTPLFSERGCCECDFYPVSVFVVQRAVVRKPDGRGERRDLQTAREDALAFRIPHLVPAQKSGRPPCAERDPTVELLIALVPDGVWSKSAGTTEVREFVSCPCLIRQIDGGSVDSEPRISRFPSDRQMSIPQEKTSENLLLPFR